MCYRDVCNRTMEILQQDYENSSVPYIWQCHYFGSGVWYKLFVAGRFHERPETCRVLECVFYRSLEFYMWMRCFTEERDFTSEQQAIAVDWGGIARSASKKGHNLLSLELTRITETKHLPFGQLKAEYEHCQLKTVWGRHGSNDWAPSELSIECGFILRCGQSDSISQIWCACCLTGPENSSIDVVVLKSTFLRRSQDGSLPWVLGMAWSCLPLLFRDSVVKGLQYK